MSDEQWDDSADEHLDGGARSGAAEASSRGSRGPLGRRTWSIVLVVVAALLAPLTVVAAWARAQIEDTDRYVATVAPLADDPDIQAYVASTLADTVYELLRVDELLTDTLPGDLAQLGPVIAPAIRGSLGDAAGRFTTSPSFSRLWEEANRAAHTIIRGVLTGDSKVTELEDGQLTLDLNALLQAFQAGLVESGFTLVAELDLDQVDRRIVLMEGAQLESIETARSLLGLLRTFSWLLFIGTIAAAVGSVLVAPDRRRGLKRLGVAVAFSMVLVAVGLSVARRAFLDAITAGLPRPVASSFFDVVVGSMRTGFRGTFVLGLLVALLVLVSERRDFAERWARPAQIAIGALGLMAIVARDDPNTGYVGFVLVATAVGVGLLELARRRRLEVSELPDGSAPSAP